MDFINTCFETTNLVRPLAWYSHSISSFIVLLLGLVVLRYAQNRQKGILFFTFTLLLSIWLIGDLIVWVSDNYFVVAAFWSYLDFINVLFYLFILYYAVHDFSDNPKIRRWTLILGTLASLPPLIITVIGQAVYEFDEPNCEMVGNDFLAVYKLCLEWVVIGVLLAMTVFAFLRRKHIKNETKRLLLTGFSLIGFLSIFSGSEFLATYTEIYEINLYALFTLPIFILLLTISIFEFKLFKLKVDSIDIVKTLFIIFIFVAVSNLLIAEKGSAFVMSAVGTVITFGFGFMILRSAEREAKQRHEIANLAHSLELANNRLTVLDKQKSEFVSIASHQLRSPLTAIRGYASMLLEGSFGKFPKKAKDSVERIEQSARLMALAIEDYLNISRIESNNMKYDMVDFNLKSEVEHICDDLRSDAIKKGLTLLFKTDLKSKGVINADLGKVVQVVQNVIHNSIKYTIKGHVIVKVWDDVTINKIFVDISDTGIGMDGAALNTIFHKFHRAEGASSVNVHGTGLGLYVALRMAQAMGGDITAYSDGEGKGSRFRIEFPLQM